MPSSPPPHSAPQPLNPSAPSRALRIDVLTLFPEMFPAVLGTSILKRAAAHIPDPANPQQVRPPVAEYHVHNIRDWSADAKHQRVDAPPYGGGPGMVIQCQPVWNAMQGITAKHPAAPRRVFVTPKGKPLTQSIAADLATSQGLVILCGHYEGLDERVLEHLRNDDQGGGLEEISLGDFVLSGGELPALVLIDAVVRLLPGALGHADSARDDSFAQGAKGLLDHPHFTRPPTWEGRDVPAVLQSGDHAAIDAWRAHAAEQLTAARRPDLLGLAHEGDPAPAAAVIVLREATGDDQAAILQLAQDHPHPASTTPDHAPHLSPAGLADLLAGPDAITSILAEQNGRLIAHLPLIALGHATETATRGLLALGPITVHCDYWTPALHRALLHEAARQARDARAARLFAFDTPTLLAELGFTPASDDGFSTPYEQSGLIAHTLDLKIRRPVTPGLIQWPAPF